MVKIEKREILRSRTGRESGRVLLGKPRTRSFKSRESLGAWLEMFVTSRYGDWVANWEKYDIRVVQ
jgi:hypothetical protein